MLALKITLFIITLGNLIATVKMIRIMINNWKQYSLFNNIRSMLFFLICFIPFGFFITIGIYVKIIIEERNEKKND